MARRQPIPGTIAYVAAVLTGLWSAWTVYLVGNALRPLATSDVVRSRILGADSASGMVAVPGLVYEGNTGIALAATEILTVTAAVFASWSVRTACRRPALLVLLAWATLWLGGSIWMEGLSNWNHPHSAIAAATGFIAAAVCTISRWRSL